MDIPQSQVSPVLSPKRRGTVFIEVMATTAMAETVDPPFVKGQAMGFLEFLGADMRVY